MLHGSQDQDIHAGSQDEDQDPTNYARSWDHDKHLHELVYSTVLLTVICTEKSWNRFEDLSRYVAI